MTVVVTSEDGDEHAFAHGRLRTMTDIKCPRCKREFDMYGDQDGQTVVCPTCALNLTIRKDDGA